jgi:hypothetical protein
MQVNPDRQPEFPVAENSSPLPRRVKGAGPHPGDPTKQPTLGGAMPPPANRPNKGEHRSPMAPLPKERLEYAKKLIQHRGMTVDEALQLVIGRLDADPADAESLATVFAQTQAAGGAQLDDDDLQHAKDRITFEGHTPESAFRATAKFWPPNKKDIEKLGRHAEQVKAGGGPRLSDRALSLARACIVENGMTVDEAFAETRKGLPEGSNFTQLRDDDRAKLEAFAREPKAAPRLGLMMGSVLQRLRDGQSLEDALPPRFRNAELHSKDLEIIDDVLKVRERGQQTQERHE